MPICALISSGGGTRLASRSYSFRAQQLCVVRFLQAAGDQLNPFA